MEAGLTGWLSLSTDPFKPGPAQLSATRVIPVRVEDANPESRGYRREIPGFALTCAPATSATRLRGE
jgi:hypothetical protein